MDVIAIRAPFCGERPFEAGAKSTAAQFRAEQGMARASARAQEHRKKFGPCYELDKERQKRRQSSCRTRARKSGGRQERRKSFAPDKAAQERRFCFVPAREPERVWNRMGHDALGLGCLPLGLQTIQLFPV